MITWRNRVTRPTRWYGAKEVRGMALAQRWDQTYINIFEHGMDFSPHAEMTMDKIAAPISRAVARQKWRSSVLWVTLEGRPAICIESDDGTVTFEELDRIYAETLP